VGARLVLLFFTFIFFITNLTAKDTLIVSVPPQKYFIEQLAKDNFNVKSMMDEDSILQSYTPSAQQYIWTENAIAYFKVGMKNENRWLKTIKIKNSQIKLFDTTIDIKLIDYSPHIWLDPKLIKIQIKNILNALIALDVKNKDFYRKNYFKFINRISRIDYQIKAYIKKNRRNSFITFNPIFEYYTSRYNVKQLTLNADPFSTEKENIIEIINQLNRLNSNLLLIPKYYFPKELLEDINKNTKVVAAPYSYLEYNWEQNILNLTKMIVFQPK